MSLTGKSNWLNPGNKWISLESGEGVQQEMEMKGAASKGCQRVSLCRHGWFVITAR
jgi:hypothetical protein